MSQMDIALELDCTQSTIWSWMHIFGIQARQSSGMKPKKRVWYKGEWLTISEASERSGVHAQCLRNRMQRGVPGDRLFDKTRRDKAILVNGEWMTITEIAERTGLHVTTISCRKRKGWSNDDLLKPRQKTGRRKKCH